MISVLGVLLLGSPSLSEGADVQWPDCYCTDKTGQRLELGQVICLQVGGREFLARCEMSQNNPMWRELSGSCLSSDLRPIPTLPQSRQNSLHAGFIHPEITTPKP
ncbi:hypothetical protein GCM10007939_04040 [Amylibacter marinus]|uniref:Uncharacterized protein n=1 Tax=Amylibacter marinus TaxID=1475483 RepID=A0ABQ5VS55_9RHOB|nr:hypothetical protein [Amylibacter marinus]GLQ34121.1 hypothetical protein GCM10007939_04040 [Amylibacter marinus]